MPLEQDVSRKEFRTYEAEHVGENIRQHKFQIGEPQRICLLMYVCEYKCKTQEEAANAPPQFFLIYR